MTTSPTANRTEALSDLAVDNFREYLRIPSVHPDVDYVPCVTFLQKQATSLGLPLKTYYPAKPNKPVVVITWQGTDPSLTSVLLNSHMDVVPVFEEEWTHKPFAADMDADGKIFARGAQDMKCVGIQYLEAIRVLKTNAWKPKRTLHLCFVPDEEIGGEDGMKTFVTTADFKNLNIGFSLDEGIASPDETFSLYYGERAIWHLEFHCNGQAGHGSLLHENTAGEKMRVILDKLFDMREEQKKILENNPEMTIGDVLTLNLCILQGGKQSNVVPPEFWCSMDCRIPVTMNTKDLYKTFESWCAAAGKDVTIVKEQFEEIIKPTELNDKNAYWVAMKQATDALGLKIKPMIFPGGTDSRYLRELNIPALGFSPMNNTPVLLHDNDEYLEKHVFLRGIDIYCRIIPALANV
ncbi:aminoacylase-1-like [Atheta coriaria]|uniref:aminoacylase-1-like n=1 Tax=Dalotia coriaria TaxID=877792 RepID=UPI0031F4300B